MNALTSDFCSLLAASQCPRGKVFSFEPDKNNFQLLKTSIAYNGFEEIIQAYNFAVSDTNKTIIISDLGNTSNSGARVTADNEDFLKSLISAPDANFKNIEAVQLDTFLTEIRVDIVKIDIEGHEPFAIRGMLNILRRDKPIIFAEFAPSNLKLFGGIEPSEFLELLLDIVYDIFLVERSGILLKFAKDIPAIMN
ncbi:FkbM family methyltransferase [Nostoc sp. FACHB-973]|nr:FkbM family methyltransferase [Nostoc sp. FACHB-973]